MLKERDERGGYADQLNWRDVHVLHRLRGLHYNVFAQAGLNPVIGELAMFIKGRVRGSDVDGLFSVGR